MANPWDNDPIVQRGSVLTLPPSPQQARSNDRQDRNDARSAANEAARLRLEMQREKRAQQEFNDKYNMRPAPGDAAKTGEDYLKTLDPAMAAQVRALSDGRRAFPTGAALRSPQVQELVAAATQYDPTLDAANAATRVATRKDFTSGKSAQNITSLNTVLGHLGDLWTASQGLHNRAFTPWNAVANEAESRIGDPALKNFNLARQAAVSEMERAFRGGQGSEKDIEEWKSALSSASSPKQFRGAMETGVKLLDSRLQALGDQYSRGMGKSADPVQLLNPHAQSVYSALGPGGDGNIHPLSPPSTGPTGGGPNGGGPGGGGPFSSPHTTPNAMQQPFLTMEGKTAAGYGAKNEQVPIPKAMQDEYNAFVAKNLGRLSPDDYATFRAGLDAKYNFGAPDQTKMDAYRKEADRLNKSAMGGAKINLGIPGPTRQMGFMGQVRNNIASDPATAGLAGSADMIGMGGLSALAPDQMAAVQQAHPWAFGAGQVGGSILGTEGLGMVAKNATKAFAPGLTKKMLGGGWMGDAARNLATDTAYGAGYGGITNGDPVGGAGQAMLGSGLGQAGGKVLGTMAGGVPVSDAVSYLRSRKIPLSVARTLGPWASKIEDGATHIPGVGDMIARRQADSFRGFNRAAFNDAGSPIGAVANTIGEQGVQSLASQVGNSYDNATAGVRVPVDDTLTSDIAAARQAGQALPGDLAVRANAAMNNRVDPAIAGGVVTGEGYQQAVRGLKGYRAEATKPGFEQDYRDVLGAGIDALTGQMERGGGASVTQGLSNANRAYRMTQVLKKASEAANKGTGSGEPYMFSPAQLNTSATANANKFGGARPFADLIDAAQQVMPSKVADSGTARRLATQGLLGVGGAAGLGALADGTEGAKDGAVADLGVTGMLSLLGTKAGQKALTSILVSRPQWASRFGGQIGQQSGLLGAATLPYYLESGQ